MALAEGGPLGHNRWYSKQEIEESPIIDALLLAARLGLAAIFFAAGAGKLADQEGSRKAMAAFGVPQLLVGAVALVLPVAELAVVAALIPTASAWYGAIAAGCLLLLFTVGIASALASGRKPDCHCFGQIHSSPAGPGTLLRNVLLAGVAAFVVVAGRDDSGYSAIAWTEGLGTAEAIGLGVAACAAVLLAVQSWFLWQVLRQNGNLLLRIEAVERELRGGGDVWAGERYTAAGLLIGSPAPPFSLEDLDGGLVSLASILESGRPALLVFTDPDCGPCNSLMPDVAEWQAEHESELTTVVISSGSREAIRAKAAEHSITATLIQPDRSVSESYGCTGTPCAVLVSPDGTIASPPAAGAGAIRDLVRMASAGLAADMTVPVIERRHTGNGHTHAPPVRGLPVGEAAPPLKLPDLDGREVDLAGFQGGRLAVLFWNPGCGYCRRMLPDLKAWETTKSTGLAALVVSRGSPEDNRAMELQSSVVIDEGFNAGRAFGASGTPSAVLLDEDGRIASAMAAGVPAVLELIRSAAPEANPR